MITAKYILENEAGERFDLTAPANIFLVNVEGLGITTNVTYGDLENGFFHTLYEQTPQNNITGDLVYQNAAYDNYQTLVNWIIRAKALYFCYQPLETEYRRIVKLNYIVKERRTAGGWMKAGISFAPLTPWYLAQPTEIGMGGIEEELSKGYFQDGEASPTIEPVQDLHGYDHPWPGGGGTNKYNQETTTIGAINSNGVVETTITAWRTSDFIGISGSAVTMSWDSEKDYYQARALFFDTSKSPMTDSYAPFAGGGTYSHTWQIPSGAAYVRLSWSVVLNNVSCPRTNIRVNIGTADIGFAPYSNICPITPGLTLVRDDESTLVVGGGTLDKASGVLMVDRAMVDLGTLNWSTAVSAGITRFRAPVAGIKRVSLGNELGQILCSNYATKTANQTYSGQVGISIQQNTDDVYIYDPQKEELSDAAFKAAMSGVQLVYELATPLTYQLTASELRRALDALDGHYAYRYTEELRYGGDAAGTMSATIEPSGHVPAAVVLRYTGAITNPRVRLVGAETGIVYGICAINTSLNPGQTFELSTRYEDSHVILIDGDGTETSLLGDVNPAYEIYFRCPTTESAVLTLESDNAFSGEATLLVYTYFGSV